MRSMNSRTQECSHSGACGALAAAGGSALIFPAFLLAANVQLASVTSLGSKSPFESRSPSLSSDGTMVAFYVIDNGTLDASDIDSVPDVYVKDLVTGTLTLSSTTALGDKGNGASMNPSLSLDGTWVAFESLSTNLDPLDDTDSLLDIYVKNLVTGELVLASTTEAGIKGNGGSDQVSISGDGRYVAFVSRSTNLDAGDMDPDWDIYVKDIVLGRLILASTSDGIKADGNSAAPSLSTDGRFVAFHSSATNLDPFDSDMILDVYVTDLTSGAVGLASITGSGTKGDHMSAFPSLSGDGTKVAFASQAGNLDILLIDTDTIPDVYVKNFLTGELELASVTASGTKGDSNSYDASLSSDGTKVAFASLAGNLDPRDTDVTSDVYVKNLVNGMLVLASVVETGLTVGNDSSEACSLSQTGAVFAFESRATNLDALDSDSVKDIYVTDFSVFVRGDVNADGQVDLSDGISLLNHLFLGDPPPPCADAADSNNSGTVDISDSVYLFDWLFLGGPPPELPTPLNLMLVPQPVYEPTVSCGPDPTNDDLSCPFGVFPPCP